MKRIISIVLCAILIMSMTGCGDTDNQAVREPLPAAAASSDLDIDLTVMSGTMVYSEVYNMVSAPEDYIGKRIRMSGLFDVYYDEDSGIYYYACIIQDATACCAQGIEFELEGDYSYPEDYPEIGSEICVEGVFDYYWDGGYAYCTLRGAEML
jgi:hypothetical protein